MVDSHFQSFFGQNTGIVVKTQSRLKNFVFFQCIKKKPNGVWEKPSANEGKTIKFSLEEVVMILQVLNRKIINWTNYHSYQNKKTHISFSWEDNNTDVLWINISDYSKMLNFAQVEILRLLLTHILNEKIIYATTSKKKPKSVFQDEFDQNLITENLFSNIYKEAIEEQPSMKNTLIMTQIEGLIKAESSKAILVQFNSDREVWIPKSTIHSQYIPRKNNTQSFLIENWILKKNNLIS
ncbi:MAG: hypothetical protein ACXACC_07300 [Promethearchaeota archaeon]|jgi:hypothetical protein